MVIGNRVTIGGLNTIDRGTYGSTVIGDGCIFDNMCHVAHNVQMGENCIILSGFLCAGSGILGNRVVASGGAMIKEHVEICDDTYLVHRAGVVKNIKEAGMYAGFSCAANERLCKKQCHLRPIRSPPKTSPGVVKTTKTTKRSKITSITFLSSSLCISPFLCASLRYSPSTSLSKSTVNHFSFQRKVSTSSPAKSKTRSTTVAASASKSLG